MLTWINAGRAPWAIPGLLHRKKSPKMTRQSNRPPGGTCYLQPRQIVSLPFSLSSSPGSTDCCPETRSAS